MGNTCGTGSAATASYAFNTGTAATVFQAGSTYRHGPVGTTGAVYSLTPFGSSYAATAPLVFSPAVSFLANSTYNMICKSAYEPYFVARGQNFGNLIWNNTGFPGSSTAQLALNMGRVDTLTITAMGTPTNATNAGRIIVYGDFINNSTTNSNLGIMIFAGSSLQKISGSNTTSPIATLQVNDKANVQLQKNINVTGAVNVLGKLDVGTNTITGSGTPSFNNFSPYNKTFNKPAGSNSPNSSCSVTAGNTTITIAGISTIPVGTNVASISHPTLFPAGTFVTAYSGSGKYVVSKAPTASADSASEPPLSITFNTGAGTFATANTAGMGGSLPSIATYNLNAGSNYIFNAATTAPFTGAATTLSIGSI
ncbi:MAG: hypothetical protein ABIX01_12440 [Chitinophagaceae bacterium]